MLVPESVPIPGWRRLPRRTPSPLVEQAKEVERLPPRVRHLLWGSAVPACRRRGLA